MNGALHDFQDKSRENCDFLQLVYENSGHLDQRLGKLKVGKKTIYRDPALGLINFKQNRHRYYLVIYDNEHTDAYLSCSPIHLHNPTALKIEQIHRRKVVVRDWFGNGEIASLKGKIEFYQESEYDYVDMELDLQGLNDTSGYHIHMTSVQESLEFPCEDSAIYGHWNPYGISIYNVPPPKQGTPDQYEAGDLSGKFGTLDGLSMLKTAGNDTVLQLFGQQSILGRSVVVDKREKRAHWVCSTIERGYAPSEARELRAIASFDRIDGFVYGYMKLTQLIHADGTQSETVIEANLRYAGPQNTNVTRNHEWAIYVNPVGVDASSLFLVPQPDTRNHEWAIYVNPVGVDATVKVLHTRCTAAGYIWNPYYTQLAAPLNVRPDANNLELLFSRLMDVGPDANNLELLFSRLMDVGPDANNLELLFSRLMDVGPDANNLELLFSRLMDVGRVDLR
ncbi:uncharacterized protein LOC103518966 [Diaphorina citri]|uniref:Uncharacterized protein LOC103518966 n=1 Tax=Diaphorina citri TaxID=121845 RepID=A0A1S3DI72_DIACI|nr:uncharacterized protein LOC103518966 [Diaphorina citri]